MAAAAGGAVAVLAAALYVLKGEFLASGRAIILSFCPAILLLPPVAQVGVAVAGLVGATATNLFFNTQERKLIGAKVRSLFRG